MSSKTRIEWTEMSWNPVTGCTKISSGCVNCYAAIFAKRLKAMNNPRYKNAFNVEVHQDLIKAPLKWKVPRKIFVNSMSDIFHEDISDEVILEIFKTMNQATWHIFQVLTKRSERMVEMSERISWTNNIWMGVTVENQNYIHRVEHLKKTGAKIKFISAEPLLSSLIDMNLENIDWLIVGGESGPNSRVIDEQWVLELRDKSELHQVPFFFKQWGGRNKKKNGRLLKGQLYNNFPHIEIEQCGI